ncbi:MAG TPA: ATP-dependent RecD-like DNA helicase [Thermoanaerobaculia bacterium]
MPETLQLTVEKVRFRSEETGFTVAIGVDHTSREEVTFVGSFLPVQEGEPLAVTGEWKNDKRWGRQFVADSVMPIVPTSAEGIESYLAAGHVKGIGAALAKRLVGKFGTDLLRVIDEQPQLLLELPGVGPRTLKKINESWGEQRGVRNVMIFLSAHGVSGARAFRIHKQYGDRAVAAIRENPYRLAYEVRGIGFSTADAIARQLGYDARSPFRVLAGLQHVIDEARQQGHCGIPVDEALKSAAELLGVEKALVEEAVQTAVAGRLAIAEKLDGQRMLFEPSLHQAEARIAAALAALADEAPAWSDLDPEEAVQIAEEESGIALDPTQRRAIDLALTSKAVVITGGPGVGKTTLVRALLAVFESAELTVSLAAPTGRAAKRLGESTGSMAQTIHRLLEMSPESGKFQRNEDNPLEADVLIVDESSMVDVPLLDAILRAMPANAALVLVGDADQLPSIGPGQVLHDILESQRVPSIRLTEIHRQAQGSQIILNAHRINRGESPQFGTSSEPSDMFFFRATDPYEAVKRVVELVTTRIPEKFGLQWRDVQVLAPMRAGDIGVHALNKALQNALNPPARHQSRVERPNDVFLCPGDKVMQMENNYDKGVFNGDVGVVATVDVEKDVFNVDFGGESIVDYTFTEAEQLTLAYATTIHKSQGSEYPAVVIALMPQHRIMLRRNLLYTAVTRGRKLVVVAGDKYSVETAVRTGRGGERWTRLAHLLRGRGKR